MAVGGPGSPEMKRALLDGRIRRAVSSCSFQAVYSSEATIYFSIFRTVSY